ncbi:ROK family protein [Roseofilum capinflatum]|uniref:ROK family protein n=1 Tax=Roseofilum capinflatum BLCC-M114 TaxID=3022440 RepID=A0ABT7BBV1_9CYAN|nr:ROK family protein [Roseofilum capinflatum]MDJ1176673.1 ROK family protein [Roseofilum capinflatum BLCC-M114]
MNEPTVIGIDIGGTGIKLGRFAKDGSCQNTLTLPTPQPATPEAVISALLPALGELDPDHSALALGVGVPGPVDQTGKISRLAINLTDWQDVPLAAWLEDKTGKPTILANDANCAGLGESWIGAGRNFQDLILLTLGTGVGGAIIIDGKLFTGRQGTAGELGLITIDLYGHECNSGNRGSLEQQVSIPAVRRLGHLDPEELGHLAETGNRQALEFWQNYGHRLGAGLANLIYVLTPEAIILGGGISQSAAHFLPATLSEIEQRVLPTSREGLQILVAELGNQAGMVGAAKLAWECVDNEQLTMNN